MTTKSIAVSQHLADELAAMARAQGKTIAEVVDPIISEAITVATLGVDRDLHTDIATTKAGAL